MTKRERVIRTIQGQSCDIFPHHSDLTYATMQKLSCFYNVPIDEVEDTIGNHLHYINYSAPLEYEEKKREKTESGTFSAKGQTDNLGQLVDEWGVTWNNEEHQEIGDWGMVDHPVRDLDFSGYEFPVGNVPGRFRDVEQELNKRPGSFKTLIMVGLLDSAAHVTGLQDCLLAMADTDQSGINHLLDNTLSFMVGVLDSAPVGVFDGVRFVEDWGVQHGLLMGLGNWRRHLKPRLRELYQTAKSKGLYIHSHSCGDNFELYSEMIELGIDISDPVQPEVMDIQKVKELFGTKLTFMGGLPCQSLLPLGTPEEVREVTERTIEIMAADGRYILGGAGSFPTETPVENIDAIVKVYREYAQKAGAEIFPR